MGQREKPPAKAAAQVNNGKKSAASRMDAGVAASPHRIHPPAKNPVLLGISIVLFLLWFAFLLVMALGG